ncbi:MAG: EMC3/TMCO1 family protein [Candidatus Woesearchaeota archaeon]
MGVTEHLLVLSPLVLILGVSFIITLISVLAYKFLTNQQRMKEIKDGMKKYQADMKKHRNNPKKLAEIQAKAMQDNIEYMKHSFKPMIFTLLPIIIIFGWLNSHLAYSPIKPGEEFSVSVSPAIDFNFSVVPQIEIIDKEIINDTAIIKMRGGEGEYIMYFETPSGIQSAELIISEKQRYSNPKVFFKKGDIRSVLISNKKMKPFGEKFNIFGYQPGWFAVYFVTTLLFSSVLRKILKVY